MIDFLSELDQQWLLLINQNGSEKWDALWIFISDKWSSLPIYALLFFLCLFKRGWRQTLLILSLVALMITCTDQLANLFKYSFTRLRPCHNASLYSELRFHYCGGRYGYFSAHAANSFALACFFGKVFWRKIPQVGVVLVLWAALIGYSRIYLAVHYPFDVLTGTAIGIAFGCGFFAIFKQLKKRAIFQRSTPKKQLSPHEKEQQTT